MVFLRLFCALKGFNPQFINPCSIGRSGHHLRSLADKLVASRVQTRRRHSRFNIVSFVYRGPSFVSTLLLGFFPP